MHGGAEMSPSSVPHFIDRKLKHKTVIGRNPDMHASYLLGQFSFYSIMSSY